jgi:RNA polymerase sigma factor (sigma-70 family)
MSDQIAKLPRAPRLTREQACMLFVKLQKARTRDRRRKVLEEVVAHYGQWACRLVVARIGHRFSESECISIALTTLVGAAMRFDSSRGYLFSTFFRRRISGAVTTFLRKVGEDQARMVPFDEVPPSETSSLCSHDPSRDDGDDEKLAAVKKALAGLTRREQYAVRLRTKGMTLEEIGKKLRVSRERARQILEMAIIRVRRDPEVGRYDNRWR